MKESRAKLILKYVLPTVLSQCTFFLFTIVDGTNKYSQTKKRTYPMNVCEHCGNGQGWYYIYKDVNEKIQEMKEIDVFTE